MKAITPEQTNYVHSRIKTLEEYKKVWQQSIDDPQKFWGQKGKELLEWKQDFSQALSEKNNLPWWFSHAKINACHNCLDRHLPKYKDKNALIWHGENAETRTLTYQELFDRVNDFALKLKELGVKPDDVVSLYMPMVPETVVTILACARIGAIHNAIFVGFSSEAISQRISDTKSKIIVTLDGCYRRGKILNIKEKIDQSLEKENCVEHVIVIPRIKKDFKQTKRDIIYTYQANNQFIEPLARNSEDPLFTLYTSGSTGKPKGVLHATAGYLLGALLSTQTVFDLRDQDIFWCTADVGWITGHTYGIYGPLLNHSTIFMYEGALDTPDWGVVWSLIEKYKITKFYTAPTAIRTLIKHEHLVDKYNLSSLQILGSVGEPLNPEAWWWYFKKIGKEKCPIVDTWWQTETGSIMLSAVPGITEIKPGSVGVALWGVKPNLQNKKSNESQALTIDSPYPSMLKTLYNDHPRFLETYFKEKNFYTGDKAQTDDKGFYSIQGRVDDVMNVSGHRLGSAELESVITSNVLVAEVAVVGKKDSIKGEVSVAFVILKKDQDNCEPLKIVLKDLVKTTIGSFAVPSEIFFTTSLPKTRSGKIMRRLLRQLANKENIVGDLTTLDEQTTLPQI
jgi:acetyl-CoA synthetase